MAAGGHEPDGAAISGINVTPLVDVMLVLLVIFMVAAPIIQQGVTVQLPQAGGSTVEGSDVALVVSVTSDGSVYLNDNRIELDLLGERLTAITAQKPHETVYLRADEKASYGAVVKVIAAIKRAGVEQLGMITEPAPS